MRCVEPQPERKMNTSAKVRCGNRLKAVPSFAKSWMRSGGASRICRVQGRDISSNISQASLNAPAPQLLFGSRWVVATDGAPTLQSICRSLGQSALISASTPAGTLGAVVRCAPKTPNMPSYDQARRNGHGISSAARSSRPMAGSYGPHAKPGLTRVSVQSCGRIRRPGHDDHANRCKGAAAARSRSSSSLRMTCIPRGAQEAFSHCRPAHRGFRLGSRIAARQAPGCSGCLILDVRLPGLSGLDIQGELAKADIQIPIIFMTGHGDIPMSVRAMKAGAVDFLTKPFRDQDMLDAVFAAIERDRRRREQDRAVSDLRARFESLSAASARSWRWSPPG